MISAALALAALLPVLPVFAEPTPSEPAPGAVFNEGATCHIAWEADPTGVWKEMNIQLMTGDNFNMIHLTTVATVDGTDPSTTTFDYPCPAVDPNSAIYFYQFSSPDAPEHTWTGRFAIASRSGQTTPEPESTQPNGQEIPWGTGRLEDPSSAVPPPPYLGGGGGSGTPSGNTNTTTATTSTTSTSTTSTTSTSTTSTLSTVRVNSTPTAGTGTGTRTVLQGNGQGTPTGDVPEQSGANGAVGAGVSKMVTTGATLAAVALVFVTVL